LIEDQLKNKEMTKTTVMLGIPSKRVTAWSILISGRHLNGANDPARLDQHARFDEFSLLGRNIDRQGENKKPDSNIIEI
jgi:hypothetical protein